MRRQKTFRPDHKEPALKTLRARILAADLATYPGDILQFDDEKLRTEGALELIQRLKKECFSDDILTRFDSALTDAAEFPNSRKLLLRFLCLLTYQNKLRGKQIAELREELDQVLDRNFELRNELSEGTLGFALVNVMRGRDLSSPEVMQEEARIRQAWREKKKLETQAKRMREIEADEQLRRRSGSSPGYSRAIDWTRPHTVQEYVDAIGEKEIHAKRVRGFLKPFRKNARRRGRGLNKPIEYPVQAGFALFEQAIIWIRDNESRVSLLFATTTFQVSLPSAVTPKGLHFRQILSPLWVRHCSRNLEPILPGISYLVSSEEGWRRWHKTITPAMAAYVSSLVAWSQRT